MKYNSFTSKIIAGAVLASASSVAMAEAQKICVFDILGAGGDIFNISQDYKIAAQKAGATVELKAYTDEKVASEDFKTGQCDGLIATSFRTRQYNGVAGSMDALGAASIVKDSKVDLPLTYKTVQETIALFSSEKAAKLMVQDKYEVGGIIPFGAAYLFVNDRGINSVEKLAGKRIGSFDYDKAQAKMIQKVGAQPISADITNFSTKFNNGSVDIIAAPAAAYKPLELQKGIGTKGAMIRFPVTVLTYQMIINKDKFPAGFGQKSREYWSSQFDRALKLVTSAEKGIPSTTWSDIPAADAVKYTVLLRESRISLSQEGAYDKRTLNIMKKIRCNINSSDSECATPTEL